MIWGNGGRILRNCVPWVQFVDFLLQKLETSKIIYGDKIETNIHSYGGKVASIKHNACFNFF